MESIQLSIKGMKCGGCVSTVEKILKNSDGIENVSVNLLTESAYFEITQKHINIETVLENLKENGFPSKIYINDRRLVIYALVTPRATKESISGRFFINDLNPLTIIPLPGKSKFFPLIIPFLFFF